MWSWFWQERCSHLGFWEGLMKGDMWWVGQRNRQGILELKKQTKKKRHRCPSSLLLLKQQRGYQFYGPFFFFFKGDCTMQMLLLLASCELRACWDFSLLSTFSLSGCGSRIPTAFVLLPRTVRDKADLSSLKLYSRHQFQLLPHSHWGLVPCPVSY